MVSSPFNMKTHEGLSLLVKREVDDQLLVMKSVNHILTIITHILQRMLTSKTHLLETEFIFLSIIFCQSLLFIMKYYKLKEVF